MGKDKREVVIHSQQTGVDYPQPNLNTALAKRTDFQDYCTCPDAPDCRCYVVQVKNK